MKNQELFDKTVAILVKAYFNKTLIHGNCYACAVGNLVCENMGLFYIKARDKNYKIVWSTISDREYNPSLTWLTVIDHSWVEANQEGFVQIESTGYTVKEIEKIEKAFEATGGIDYNRDKSGYKGLMSVVDCLMKIHEATKEEAQSAKELFVLTT